MEMGWFYDEEAFELAEQITETVVPDEAELNKKFLKKFKCGEDGKKVLEEYANEITKRVEEKLGGKSNVYTINIATKHVEIYKNVFGTYIAIDRKNVEEAFRDIFGFAEIRAILPIEAIIATSLFIAVEEGSSSLDRYARKDSDKVHFLFLGSDWVYLLHKMIEHAEKEGTIEDIYKKFNYDCVVLPHHELLLRAQKNKNE